MTLTEEKLNCKNRIELRFNEKSFEKKQSINVLLAAADNSRFGSPHPVRIASSNHTPNANGSLFSKFKDSAAGLE